MSNNEYELVKKPSKVGKKGDHGWDFYLFKKSDEYPIDRQALRMSYFQMKNGLKRFLFIAHQYDVDHKGMLVTDMNFVIRKDSELSLYNVFKYLYNNIPSNEHELVTDGNEFKNNKLKLVCDDEKIQVIFSKDSNNIENTVWLLEEINNSKMDYKAVSLFFGILEKIASIDGCCLKTSLDNEKGNSYQKKRFNIM